MKTNGKYWIYKALGLALAGSLLSSVVRAVDSTDVHYQDASFTLVNGTTYVGHYSFLNGITLPTGATSTLKTFGRLNGTLAFDPISQPLVLDDDLICGSKFAISGGGSIYGNGYALNLSSNLLIDGGTTNLFVDNSDLVINGNGSTLSLAGEFALTVEPGITLTLRNMNLVLSNSLALTLVDGSTLILDNVNVFLQGADVETSAAVNLIVKGIGSLNGNGRTLTAGNLTIQENASFKINVGCCLAASANGAIALSGVNSLLALNGCTLNASAAGLTLTKGMVTFENQVQVLATGKTFQLGDGASSGNNTEAKVLAGANVIVDGTFYHRPA